MFGGLNSVIAGRTGRDSRRYYCGYKGVTAEYAGRGRGAAFSEESLRICGTSMLYSLLDR